MPYTLCLPRWSKIVLWIGFSFQFLSYTNESDRKTSQSTVSPTLIIWGSLIPLSQREELVTLLFSVMHFPCLAQVVFSCFLCCLSPYCYCPLLYIRNTSDCHPRGPQEQIELLTCSCTNVLTVQTVFILVFERDSFHSQSCKSKPFFLQQNAPKLEGKT